MSQAQTHRAQAQAQEPSPAKTSLSFLLNNENDANTLSESLSRQRNNLTPVTHGTRIQSSSPDGNVIDLTNTPVSPPRPYEVVEILDDDSEDDDVVVTRVVERSASASGGTNAVAPTAEVRANERRRRRREFAGFLNAILTAAHHHHHHHFHPYPRQATPPFPAPLFMPLVQPPTPPRRKTRGVAKPKAPRPTRPGFTRTILPEDAPDAMRRDPECPICDKGLRGGEMWAVKGCGHVVCGACVGGLKEKKKCGVCEKRVRGAGDVLQLFV